jgi:predicted RNA-binding protein with PIN domain
MRIIVDGYNFIGRDKGLRGDLKGKRDGLIKSLSAYRRNKGFPVTVVFDGGKSADGEEWGERIGGVEVLFSRHGESADEVICRMAEELREGCTVVSSDREVQQRVRQYGGIAIYSGEFEARLKAVLAPSEPPAEKDDLPESDRARGSEKKGNPRRLSKAERRRQGRLKRL